MSYLSSQGTLPAATPTTVYTCPTGRDVVVQSIRVTNPGAFIFTVKKYVYATSTTVQLYTVNLSAGDILTDTNFISMRAGDYLELTSNIANTNYIIFISEY